MQQKILVINGEPNLRRSLSLLFENAGYWVLTATNTQDARQYLDTCQVDLVFLDLSLTGRELLEDYQQWTRPALILTTTSHLELARQAVRNGARDYLLKPADPALILNRVNDLLAEYEASAPWTEAPNRDWLRPIPAPDASDRFLTCGRLELDLHARHVTLGDEYLPLSLSEFNCLEILARHAPHPVSCETLIRDGMHLDAAQPDALPRLRILLERLCDLLEQNDHQPRLLLTERGCGYCLAL